MLLCDPKLSTGPPNPRQGAWKHHVMQAANRFVGKCVAAQPHQQKLSSAVPWVCMYADRLLDFGDRRTPARSSR